jgi:hypothetical protein
LKSFLLSENGRKLRLLVPGGGYSYFGICPCRSVRHPVGAELTPARPGLLSVLPQAAEVGPRVSLESRGSW